MNTPRFLCLVAVALVSSVLAYGQETRPAGAEEDIETRREAIREKLLECERLSLDESSLETIEKALASIGKDQSALDDFLGGRFKELTAWVAKVSLTKGLAAGRDLEKKDDLRGALTTWDLAVDRAARCFRWNFALEKDQALRKLYTDMIEASDALVEKVESAEFIESVKEKDLLASRSAWGASAGARLSWPEKQTDAVLEGVEVPGKKMSGVIAIDGGNSPWRDIKLDLEFTIVSGSVELFFRYVPGSRNYSLMFRPEDGWALNQKHHVTFLIKASEFEMWRAGDPKSMTQHIQASVSRTGGVGFVFDPGSKVVISKCRVKVLRPFTGS